MKNTFWAISMLDKLNTYITTDIEALMLWISIVLLWKQNTFLKFLRSWSLEGERWN